MASKMHRYTQNQNNERHEHRWLWWWLVGWLETLTSLFSTNTAISETRWWCMTDETPSSVNNSNDVIKTSTVHDSNYISDNERPHRRHIMKMTVLTTMNNAVQFADKLQQRQQLKWTLIDSIHTRHSGKMYTPWALTFKFREKSCGKQYETAAN